MTFTIIFDLAVMLIVLYCVSPRLLRFKPIRNAVRRIRMDNRLTEVERWIAK